MNSYPRNRSNPESISNRDQAESRIHVWGIIGPALYIFALALGLTACSKSEPSPAQPDVLLLVADALRADHLGCYGGMAPTSPNLDRLAPESALFESYYTVVPTTLPSFISLFTSMHPKAHGAARNGVAPVEGLDSLGAAFQQAGYETAFFISSYSLTPRFGTRLGFDHFDDNLDLKMKLPSNKLIRSASSVTQAFLDWRQRRESSKPYFAVIHYFDPHWPYIPPREHARPFVKSEEALDEIAFHYLHGVREKLEASGGVPSKKAEFYYRLYCAEIRHMDHEIGRIIQTLDAPEATGNDTVLVFTSDHGETFWEHEDYFNHGLTVYDTGIRIPLLVRAPGRVAPGRRAQPTFSNIDLAPTLLGLLGIPRPAGFTGHDLHAALTQGNPGKNPDVVFSESTKPHEEGENAPRPNLPKAKCIIQGPWKFIWTPWQEGREELYNRESDPDELIDLAGDPEQAPRIKALRERLGEWARDWSGVKGTERFNPEVNEKLKELGYGN